MSAPTLAVVIPTHDRPERLARAVRSVARQRAFAEIVVVDDASDPPVSLQGADPRVVVLRHGANRGVSAARNTGIGATRASHLIFLDDDDALLPLAGAAFARWARRRPDRVSCGAVLIRRPGRRTLWRVPPSSEAGEIWGLDHALDARGDVATKQAALYPRALLERLGGWDEAMTSRETSELFFRLCAMAPVDGHRWPVYGLDRGAHPRLTKDMARRERNAAYIRFKHAALLADPARREAFERNHAFMVDRMARAARA